MVGKPMTWMTLIGKKKPNIYTGLLTGYELSTEGGYQDLNMDRVLTPL